MEENFIFEGKVVVVTGGATGIGAGLVRSILSHNARVSFILLQVLKKSYASISW